MKKMFYILVSGVIFMELCVFNPGHLTPGVKHTAFAIWLNWFAHAINICHPN